jgi:NAD-dependent SIR2 family protein deacetylase
MRVVHMHGELFKSRCDRCTRTPFCDANTYDPPAEIPRCECGGRIRPHICWFGEVPFELDSIFRALDECTVFMAVGTSGVVEPAASFVAQVGGRARTMACSIVPHPASRNSCGSRPCQVPKLRSLRPRACGEYAGIICTPNSCNARPTWVRR